MQNISPEIGTDIASDVADFAQTAQDRACTVIKSGTEYVKENPLPVVFGAFLVGAAVGSLLLRREREVETDRLHAALNWIEDSYNQLADKIPHAKRKLFSCNPPGFLEQAQGMGKKLKWW